ncbi:MAG: serine hydrolase [Ferruginibacter sp.]
MIKRKHIKKIFLLLFLVILVYAIQYAWVSLPIISGYGAKNLCSCMFVAGRDVESVKKEELGDFPLSLAHYNINYIDSSVTASVFGVAVKKAFFRKRLGCTLINELSENEIRSQHFRLAMPPSINTDSIEWPAGDKISEFDQGGIDLQNLKVVLNNFIAEYNSPKKHGTRALIVLYDGKLVGEEYAVGFNKESKMLCWSMVKSVMGTLTGILVKNHRLNTMLPAPIAEWRKSNDDRKLITLQQLLQQTSGLRFEENYTKASEVTNMLFKKGDMAGYTASLPLAVEPGRQFNYSSGNSNLLSRIIRQALGENAYHAFPYDSLFYKIGMFHTLIEPDATGTFIGSSYMYATARDCARLGLLYYNDGIINGQQILPEGWVKDATTPSTADKRKHYGYQFWLNGFDRGLSKRWYPDVPADMYFADGFNGQDIYIIPSKKLVVVRLGLHVVDENKLLKNIISCTH